MSEPTIGVPIDALGSAAAAEVPQPAESSNPTDLAAAEVDAAPEVAQPPASLENQPINEESAQLTGEDAETVAEIAGPKSQPPANEANPPQLAAGASAVPSVQVQAYSGAPYGIGNLQITFDDATSYDWYSDQTMFLTDGQNRIKYPVFLPTKRPGEHRLSELNVSFLFLGEGPLRSLQLKWGDQPPIAVEQAELQADPVEFERCMNQWWTDYSNRWTRFRGEQFDISRRLQRVIGQRVGRYISPPSSDDRRGETTAQLEQGFEKIVSRLFGIDSLLVSMPDYALSDKPSSPEKADRPLPQSLQLPSVAVPSIELGVHVEEIAKNVPADCFYVRCKSLGDCNWVREFLMGWGGSLDDIVAMPSTEHGVREKLEHQLSLGLEKSMDQGLAMGISDMAIIGGDLLFAEGAELGVLLEAQDQRLVDAVIQSQRRETIAADPEVKETVVQLAGRQVSLLATPDNQVRSFYVVNGKYHLVTNSRSLAERFLQLSQSENSLGRLAEFRYARSKFLSNDKSPCFIYLSDPFFRNLTSPAYRIELLRRAKSIAELKQANVAALVAHSEATPVESLEQLRQNHYLPVDFGISGDSRPQLVNGTFVDSLRGRRGTFLPVPDLTISNATATEVADYYAFTSRYRKEWRVADPLIVEFTTESQSPDQERVGIKICVAPYARRRYAFLTANLAPSTTAKISPIQGDLLALDAMLRQGRQERPIHVALQDAGVSFSIVDGELVTTGSFASSTLLSRNMYAAVTPGGDQSLDQIQEFMSEFDLFSNNSANRPGKPYVLFAVVGALFGREQAEQLYQSFRSNYVQDFGQWSVAARSGEVRTHVTRQLNLERAVDPAQIHFHLSDVTQSQANPYIQAYTYLQSRKASTSNAQFVELFSQQLGVPSDQALASAERLLGGELVCPLGGTYRPTIGDARRWNSSAWTTATMHQLNEVPRDYRYPFLQWLQGMDLRFALQQNSLLADIDLTIRTPDSASRSLAKPLSLNASPTLVPASAALPASPPSTVVTAAKPVVDGSPDLVISSLTAQLIQPGQVRFSYTITNVGDGPASLDGRGPEDHDNVSVQAYLSRDTMFRNDDDSPAGGTILGRSPLGMLQPGESCNGSFRSSIQGAVSDFPYLVLMVDWQDSIAESNEKNNTAAVAISTKLPLPPRPQPTNPTPAEFKNVTVTPGPLVVGSLVTIGYDLTSDANGAKGRAAGISGVRQHWIERQGPNTLIPAIGNHTARRGNKYAASGWTEYLSLGETRRFERVVNTAGYPPGIYTFTIEWRQPGYEDKFATVDFELRARD